jgi:hypothetical protein
VRRKATRDSSLEWCKWREALDGATHDKIRSAVREASNEMGGERKRKQFLKRRIKHFRRECAGRRGLFLCVTPEVIDEEMISIPDEGVLSVLREEGRETGSIVWRVEKVRPSLDGLAAWLPWDRREQATWWFEVHRSGHVELRYYDERGELFRRPEIGEGEKREKYIAIQAEVLARSVWDMVRKACRMYDVAKVVARPFVVSLTLENVERSMLSGRGETGVGWGGGGMVEKGWFDRSLTICVWGSSSKRAVAAKRVCDRLWQAYGEWECPLIDDEGNWKEG